MEVKMHNLDEEYSPDYEKPGSVVFSNTHGNDYVEKPKGFVEIMKDAIGYETGKEIQFWIGVAIDIVLFIIWLILIFTVLDSSTRNSLWYIPILGIIITQ